MRNKEKGFTLIELLAVIVINSTTSITSGNGTPSSPYQIW